MGWGVTGRDTRSHLTAPAVLLCPMPSVETFVAEVTWRFAKTMPDWPHWYVMKPWNPGREAEFMELARRIFEEGRDEQWAGLTTETNPSPTSREPSAVISCRCPDPSTTRIQLSAMSAIPSSRGSSQYANPPYMPGTGNQAGSSWEAVRPASPATRLIAHSKWGHGRRHQTSDTVPPG